jgi:hypothetical protein
MSKLLREYRERIEATLANRAPIFGLSIRRRYGRPAIRKEAHGTWRKTVFADLARKAGSSDRIPSLLAGSVRGVKLAAFSLA